MAKFSNPDFIALIQKHLPAFDFKKERTAVDMRQIRDIVLKKEEMWVENKKRKERLELIEKRGLEPGVEVCSSNGKRGFISKIDKNGYVVLKGARGAFNPIGIEHV